MVLFFVIRQTAITIFCALGRKKQVKAIILAAGRGSRMGVATEDLPKCMAKLGGDTLLNHLVRNLRKACFESDDIGIVTGYKREKINLDGTTFFYNTEWEKTNMFYSLLKASEWLESESCLVCYSDIYISPNTIELLKNAEGDIAITSYTEYLKLWQMRFDNPLVDLEAFKLEGNKLIKIGNRPKYLSEVQGQFMGLLRFTPRGWKTVIEATKTRLPKPIEKIDMTGLLQHLVELGHGIEVLDTDDLWLEVDSQEDIVVYEEHFKLSLY